MEEARVGLSSSALKWIAAVSMVIDHVGILFFPELTVFRIIGRIAFPLFCFVLAEGFFYTRNIRKYLLRLLLFAFLSEIPFDLAFSGVFFDPESQNVFWTLFLGLLLLTLCRKLEGAREVWIFPLLAVFCAAAYFLNTDYSLGGILIIFVFYYFRNRKWIRDLLYALILILVYGGIEAAALVCIVPMHLYNRKRGRPMKYFFYLFYPCHILALYLIRLFVP